MGQLSDAESAFSEIYRANTWGNGSGVGSEPRFTTEYVEMLQRFLAQHGIKSVVDYGCGDWQFSQLIDWTGIEYRGFDVVASVIDANRQRFGSANVRFEQVTDGTSLPRADLLICKDVLQHLPTAVVKRDLWIFKQLYPHLLITNDIFPAHGANSDIDAGQWRPLRLDQPPFSERFDVPLTWDVIAYGCHWTKQTCHIRTKSAARPLSIELRDEPRKPSAVVGSTLRRLKQTIIATPIIGPIALKLSNSLKFR